VEEILVTIYADTLAVAEWNKTEEILKNQDLRN